MKRVWPGVLALSVGCSAGELGDAAGDDAALVDSTSLEDVSFTETSSPVDSGIALDTPGADTAPPPFDGAPADLGGDGGCTFGGTTLASAIVTTDVASAAPSGEAILTERPGGLAVAWRSSAGWRVTPLALQLEAPS
jgi:hypothetical protein